MSCINGARDTIQTTPGSTFTTKAFEIPRKVVLPTQTVANIFSSLRPVATSSQVHTINVQPVLTDASNGNTLTSSAKRSSTQKPDSSRNTFSKMPVLLLVPPLPSQPKSDVTLIKGNIVLSWNMEKASATPIVKYEICSYLVEDLQHVTSKDPWRCVATFEATRLPMACSLMDFNPV